MYYFCLSCSIFSRIDFGHLSLQFLLAFDCYVFLFIVCFVFSVYNADTAMCFVVDGVFDLTDFLHLHLVI